MLTVHFVSLGCDKNLVDSEVMLGILREEGFEPADRPETADVIVVNTCGFIADALTEAVETVLEMAEYKKRGNCRALVVAGCMATRFQDEIFAEIPEADAVVGPGSFAGLGETVRRALAGERAVNLVRTESEQFYAKRRVTLPNHYAYMKIAEGCDNRCTYCTIPAIRGPYRSRPIEGLLAEARALAEAGVKELILVAQDTALYGTDLYGESRLHELLPALCEVAGLAWIRLLYAYPEHLTDATVAAMAAVPKVCRYLDLPVQHAHPDTLRRMGRRGGYAAIDSALSRLRAAMPDIALRTTLITGFPGETEAEFQALLDFVAQERFDRLGVFEYAREAGTPAYDMEGQVPKREKKRRRDAVMRLQQEISAQKRMENIGKTLEVITDGYLPEKGLYQGRTRADAPDVDGAVFFRATQEILSGEILEVDILRALEYDIVGVVR